MCGRSEAWSVGAGGFICGGGTYYGVRSVSFSDWGNIDDYFCTASSDSSWEPSLDWGSYEATFRNGSDSTSSSDWRECGGDILAFFILRLGTRLQGCGWAPSRVKLGRLPHCECFASAMPRVTLIIVLTALCFWALVTSRVTLVRASLVWESRYSSSELLLSEDSSYCLEGATFFFEAFCAMCTWNILN